MGRESHTAVERAKRIAAMTTDEAVAFLSHEKACVLCRETLVAGRHFTIGGAGPFCDQCWLEIDQAQRTS